MRTPRCLTILFLVFLVPGLALAGDPTYVYTFTATDATVLYDPLDGEGSATVGIWITEDPGNVDFPNLVDGWAMGNACDANLVEVISVEEGAYLQTINGGSGPDFFGPNLLPDGFTIGCVYSFTGSAVCTYEVPKEAASVTYNTVSVNLVGDLDGEVAPLQWVDTLADPMVVNTLVIWGLGYAPIFEDGQIDLVPFVEASWVRGDCNGDGNHNIADGIWTLNALFQNGGFGSCLAACDSNGDGELDSSDAIYSFNYLLLEGPPPPAPFPECGNTEDDDCNAYAPCLP